MQFHTTEIPRSKKKTTKKGKKKKKDALTYQSQISRMASDPYQDYQAQYLSVWRGVGARTEPSRGMNVIKK